MLFASFSLWFWLRTTWCSPVSSTLALILSQLFPNHSQTCSYQGPLNRPHINHRSPFSIIWYWDPLLGGWGRGGCPLRPLKVPRSQFTTVCLCSCLAGLRRSFRLGRKSSRAREAARSRRWSTGVDESIPPPTYKEVIPYRRDPSDKHRLVILVGTYELNAPPCEETLKLGRTVRCKAQCQIW